MGGGGVLRGVSGSGWMDVMVIVYRQGCSTYFIVRRDGAQGRGWRESDLESSRVRGVVWTDRPHCTNAHDDDMHSFVQALDGSCPISDYLMRQG